MAGELENFLSEWSSRREIEVAERDGDGKVFLVFDGEHEIAMSQLGGSIYMEANLTAVPSRRDEAEAVIENLMKLQLVQARKDDNVLSVTAEDDTLTMFRVLRADRINLNGFERALGGFVNSVAFMTSQLEPEANPVHQRAPMNTQVFFP